MKIIPRYGNWEKRRKKTPTLESKTNDLYVSNKQNTHVSLQEHVKVSKEESQSPIIDIQNERKNSTKDKRPITSKN